MPQQALEFLRRHVPGFARVERLPRQLLRRSPFGGSIVPTRVPLFAPFSSRPALPFPHPWNYHEPLRILETYFHGADDEQGDGRHNRWLEIPLCSPIFVTRDPGVIRAICTKTGESEGDFDRDTLPTGGIARATGENTLLYANGSVWKRQRRLATPPFGKSTLFQPEQFHEFEDTFRRTVAERLGALTARLSKSGKTSLRVALEPEIKCVMLEMLVNNFFGAEVSYADIKDRYVGSLQRVIDHIVRDTVTNKIGIPIRYWPSFTRGIAQAKVDYADFEKLTDLALAPRKEGKALWKQFKSDAPDAALRSNIKVFLAGALEATTSYASWAVSHLSRDLEAQERVYQEVKDVEDYTPENLDRLKSLSHALNETLRLTPSLYFLPRRASADTLVETADGRTLRMPAGTHIFLDVWHANRHEDHWGVEATGHPALDYAPQRWAEMAAQDRSANDALHFGFGHGPRFCPGRHLGQLEVSLVVGAIVKLFKFKAVRKTCPAKAGVSTKPADETLVELELRDPAVQQHDINSVRKEET